MKKTLLYSTILSVFLLGCGEAGFESDVSKVTEVSFTFEPNDFAQSSDFYFAYLNETFDPANEEFSDYLDDIENYFINKIEIEIKNINFTNSPRLLAVRLSAHPGNAPTVANIIDEVVVPPTPLINALTNNGTIHNSGKVVVYDRENNANGLVDDNNAGIQQILSSLENKSSLFTWLAFAIDMPLDGSFDAVIYLDLTARTQLD